MKQNINTEQYAFTSPIPQVKLCLTEQIGVKSFLCHATILVQTSQPGLRRDKYK